MTRHRRSRSVFDQLTAALRVQIEVVSNPCVDRAITRGHEAAHAVIADMFGIAGGVYINDDGSGEAYYELAPCIEGMDDARTVRAKENALLALAGPASETIMLARWAIAGTGSSDDFLAAWRYLARDEPDESLRELRITQLFGEAQRLLAARWGGVANVAGHVLVQGELFPGQAQRILRGVELDRSQVFFNALRGIE